MMEFGSMLMQTIANGTIPPAAVITTPPTNVAETITALIVAIGGLLAAVATIVQRIGDRKELSSHKEAIHNVSNILGDLGNHMISSKEDIKTLAEVTYDFSPDKAKELVNKQNIRLAELTKKLEDATTKLGKVPPVISRI